MLGWFISIVLMVIALGPVGPPRPIKSGPVAPPKPKGPVIPDPPLRSGYDDGMAQPESAAIGCVPAPECREDGDAPLCPIGIPCCYADCANCVCLIFYGCGDDLCAVVYDPTAIILADEAPPNCWSEPAEPWPSRTWCVAECDIALGECRICCTMNYSGEQRAACQSSCGVFGDFCLLNCPPPEPLE